MSNTITNVITVDYKLFKDTADGEMIESTEENQLLVFLSGLGQMIPEFESNIVNLAKGDRFSFGIKAENAYGVSTEESIIELPQEMFEEEGKLVDQVVVGNILPLEDQNGQVHPARVVSINEETVTMDVNHPLADQDLYFTGSIVEVRPATEDEIQQGHVLGAGGVAH